MLIKLIINIVITNNNYGSNHCLPDFGDWALMNEAKVDEIRWAKWWRRGRDIYYFAEESLIMKHAITIIALLIAMLTLPAMGETVQYWYDQANGYYISGDFEKAAASYDKAIELKPNSTVLWNLKGKALSMLGRYDEAVNCFDKSITINASDLEAMNLKAMVLSEGQEKYSDAIALFDHMLLINPLYFDAWNGKGMALGHIGSLADSLKCFEKATEIRPLDAVAWNNKGAVLLNMERYQDALSCFNKALLIDPSNENAIQNRQNTLQAMNEITTPSVSQSTATMD